MERIGKYPATRAQFTKGGTPYEMGDTLVQADLAETLVRISENGPAGFYEGKTAELIAKEMAANGGIITEEDLKGYQPKKRTPVRGNYRGFEGHLDAAPELRGCRGHRDCSTSSKATI